MKSPLPLLSNPSFILPLQGSLDPFPRQVVMGRVSIPHVFSPGAHKVSVFFYRLGSNHIDYG